MTRETYFGLEGGGTDTRRPLGNNASLGMCYLDVAADAERLPAGGEERVQHLLGCGLHRLLRLLPLDTLRDNVWAGRGGANVEGVISGDVWVVSGGKG